MYLELTVQTADKTIHEHAKKAAQPNHLLHHLLHTKPTPTSLKSRQLDRLSQETTYR